MKPSYAVSKKARKSSRFYNEHRNAHAFRRMTLPSATEKRAFMDRLRAMFRPRESETKTGTATE